MKNQVMMKELQELVEGLSDLGYKGVEHLIALLEDRDPNFNRLAPNVVLLLNTILKIERKEENIARSLKKQHMLYVIKEAEDTIEMIEIALKEHTSSANTKLLKKLNKRFSKVIAEEHESKWIPKP